MKSTCAKTNFWLHHLEKRNRVLDVINADAMVWGDGQSVLGLDYST